VTVLGDDPEYETAVNAARYQIGVLERQADGESDAAKIVSAKLKEADALMADNQVIEARKIWYSLVELYGDNSELKPLIDQAQQQLIENN